MAQGSKDAVRAKAQQMREQQARADKRMRNIIIGVVTVVVVATIAAVTVVILNESRAKQAVNGADPASVLGSYAQGAPIILSHKGIGQKDDSLPTVTEYYDYSCHICADVDGRMGNQLSQGAIDGKYNVEYRSVETVKMKYQYAATTASLIVAQKAPNQWVSFHHALMKYFDEQYKAGNGTVVQDLQKSAAQVKKLAEGVGVPADVVASFPENAADDYLKKASDTWLAETYEGRDPKRLGTPEFIANNKKVITLAGTTGDELVSSVTAALGQ